MPHSLWHLERSLSDFESIDATNIPFDDSMGMGLGLSLGSNTTVSSIIPSESTSGAPSPKTPASSRPSLLMGPDHVPDYDPPTCLDQLRTILGGHYPDTKPPGQLFRNFIYRKKDLNHCKLCSKALENREQMNQHIMKVHCDHFPFACDEPGW
jgi:hypothetical protein